MSRPAAVASTTTGIKLGKAVPRSLFFGVFAISGFSGLIYESIWSHYLKLFLGHAAYAQSLVLIIFMGGLAIGSWLAAKSSERWRAPILIYAVVEGIIGVIALLFHDVFVALAGAFHSSVLPSIDSATLGNVLKWTAAATLIVPQSVLLGMTFPLMSTGILRRYPDQPGGSLGMLYFTNSIGAALGVLVSGFWLIGVFGLPGTIMTAGLLNIALALAVWILVKLDPQPFAPPLRAAPAATSNHDDIAVLFFFAAALTGASSFMYEIGWVRMLSLVLGATTHSFELMLSAFITGLAFGGLWIKRRIDRIADPIRFSGWVQILMGVLAALTIPLYAQTFDWMAGLLGALQRTDGGYALFTVFSHGIALLVMVPTTFLAGMTLPLFTYVLLRGRQGERAIGRVYASNTLGAILGVLFAVHVGLPLLGLKNLIGLAAAIDMLLGLVLLYRTAGAHQTRALVPAGLLCAVVLVVVSATVSLDPRNLGSGVYRTRTAQLSEQTTIVYYRDGKTASISLTAQDGQLSISTNGKPDASIQMDPRRAPTPDEITMVMAAALPLAYQPDARRVANIGLGSGLTTHTFLGEPSIERVDTIEIEPFMVEAAQGFGERVARTFGDPRSHIHVEDAKTFFSLQNETYDIIVAEPSNPWVSGVASLFSDEFYRVVPRYLSDDGLFVQWLQLYEFNDDLALSVLKALSANFSDYAIYNTDNSDILIVAKHMGSLATPEFARILAGALKPDLQHVGLHNASDFVVRNTGAKPLIESLIAHTVVPRNSDFYPFLDLHAGRARFRAENAGLFYAWSVAPLPMLEVLGVDSTLDATIAPHEGFERTLRIGKARGLYAELKGAPSPPGATTATQHDTILAALLRALGESCGGSQSEEQWLDVLHTLSVTSLPFLESAQATDLLDTVVPPACAAQRSPQFRAWLNLYHTVAARNTAGMAAAAAEVLASPGTEPAKVSYAVAAAMLGRLAQGQPREAIGVWERHATTEAAEKQPELRLLLSMALQRHSETAGATGRRLSTAAPGGPP